MADTTINKIALQKILEINKGKKEAEKNKKQGIEEIKIDTLLENPYQPRLVMDDKKIKELSESIKVHGLMQPIIVQRKGLSNFTIIAGHRRVVACKILGMKNIKAIILKNNDNKNLGVKAFIENIQRENLSPLELAVSLNFLKEENSLTIDEISKEIGKDKGYVSKVLSILKLPKVILEKIKEKNTKDVISLNLINSIPNKIKNKKGINDEVIIEKQIEAFNVFEKEGREGLKNYINNFIKRNKIKTDINISTVASFKENKIIVELSFNEGSKDESIKDISKNKLEQIKKAVKKILQK